jgi:F420-dependent oxidoreductase-like protein
MRIRVPHGALVVLVGPSGSGKSSWAAQWFRPDQVVSSDGLRAVVGEGEHDQRAGTDAFDVLDMVVERRLKRGLATVVDSLGFDDERRRGWVAAARRHGRAAVAVVFPTPEKECRARNRLRPDAVPTSVLTGQFRRFAELLPGLGADGFDAVHDAAPAVVVPAPFVGSDEAAAAQATDPVPLRFGLHLSSYTWPGSDAGIGPRLGAVAAEAEAAGFSSVWVMDHLMQIPQVGRGWEPMLDSWTTLGYLAALTERVRLGVLVSAITFRNIAHLAKIAATLDVLSVGRAICGLGAAWYEQEHRAYGYRFPPVGERYELLEDALELLPLMWGPGSPAYEGRRISVPEAVCYPRPLQERIPILVGGSGERRTLRLVASHADACNLMGEAGAVAGKVEVLRKHCEAEGRDPDAVVVTHLSSVLAGPDHDSLARFVAESRPDGWSADAHAAHVNAATVDELVGRFRRLADAGVQEAIVRIADVGTPGSVERFAPVVDAFRG